MLRGEKGHEGGVDSEGGVSTEAGILGEPQGGQQEAECREKWEKAENNTEIETLGTDRGGAGLIFPWPGP